MLYSPLPLPLPPWCSSSCFAVSGPACFRSGMQVKQVFVAARFFSDYSRCRHAALRTHFGDHNVPKACYACDVCCARRLGISIDGRPRTRDAFADAQILVHLTCALYGHGVTPHRLRKIALGQQLPISSAADRLFADDAKAMPEFGVLKGLGVRAVNKLIQQLVQKHVLSLSRCLNNVPTNRKGRLVVQRLSGGRAMQTFWRRQICITLESDVAPGDADDAGSADQLTQDLEQLMSEC